MTYFLSKFERFLHSKVFLSCKSFISKFLWHKQTHITSFHKLKLNTALKHTLHPPFFPLFGPVHISLNQRVIKLSSPCQTASGQFLLVVVNRHKDVLNLVGHFFFGGLVKVTHLVLLEEQVVFVLIVRGDLIQVRFVEE
jgi:hypothetical protein